MFWHTERVRTVRSLLTCNVLAHGEGLDSEVLTDM